MNIFELTALALVTFLFGIILVKYELAKKRYLRTISTLSDQVGQSLLDINRKTFVISQFQIERKIDSSSSALRESALLKELRVCNIKIDQFSIESDCKSSTINRLRAFVVEKIVEHQQITGELRDNESRLINILEEYNVRMTQFSIENEHKSTTISALKQSIKDYEATFDTIFNSS